MSFRDDAADAVRQMFDDGVTEQVLGDEAFGALVAGLRRADTDSVTPEEALSEICPEDLEFTGCAEHPAAFLASRLPY